MGSSHQQDHQSCWGDPIISNVIYLCYLPMCYLPMLFICVIYLCHLLMWFCYLNNNAFYFATFIESGAWWETSATNGTSGTAAGGDDVLAGGIDFGGGKFTHVKVSGVLCVGCVAYIISIQYFVKKKKKKCFQNLPAFLKFSKIS